jgi:hypothetical protein
MSLYPRTLTVRSKVIGCGLNRDVCVVSLPSAGAQLQTRSYRSAACSVIRPTVHWSWANNPMVCVRSCWSQRGARKYETVTGHRRLPLATVQAAVAGALALNV